MRIQYFIVIIALFFLTSGCYASDITGTVVDAETGKPIEGAVVLVEWTKTKGIGFTSTESYKVVEVFTDKEGKFTVTSVSAFFVTPHLTIYKKGYVAWNNEYVFQGYKKREDFKWRNGYMFRMERFKEEYSYNDHVSFIRSSIGASQNLEAKKNIYNAFEWEDDLAQKERIKKGLSP